MVDRSELRPDRRSVECVGVGKLDEELSFLPVDDERRVGGRETMFRMLFGSFCVVARYLTIGTMPWIQATWSAELPA
jgi:hypothetical protein